MEKLRLRHPVRPRLGRALLALVLAIAATAGAAWLLRDPDEAGLARPTAVRSAGPLEAALVSCRRLGDAALRDPRCRAAWGRHREHFLQLDRRLGGPR